jgi:hypothetical protein
MNWKRCGRKRLWPDLRYRTISAFAWRDWEIRNHVSRKTSIMISDLRVEIWTLNLPNMKQKSRPRRWMANDHELELGAIVTPREIKEPLWWLLSGNGSVTCRRQTETKRRWHKSLKHVVSGSLWTQGGTSDLDHLSDQHSKFSLLRVAFTSRTVDKPLSANAMTENPICQSFHSKIDISWGRNILVTYHRGMPAVNISVAVLIHKFSWQASGSKG